MPSIIQLRRDTAANWTSVNPILADGEQGYEKDTGLQKIGDGLSLWTLLPYFSSGAGGIDAVVDDLTPHLGGNLDINGSAIFSVSDSENTNDINILAGSTNYNNDETQASGINLVGGDHLASAGEAGRAGGIRLTGGAMPDSVGSTVTGYGGEVVLTGGNVPEAAEAWGGRIILRGGDSYSASGRSNGGRVHLKGGEAFDFPGDVWLEPGGAYGDQNPDGMVVIRSNVYVGGLGTYGGQEMTTVLAFEGLQSNTTLGLNSERIKDNFVGIRAPDAVNTEYLITLPADAPTGPGEVLTTDTFSGGSRNLVWAVPGGGGGGVNNPMTENLVTGGYAITGADGPVGQTVSINAGASSTPGAYGGRVDIMGGDSVYSGGGVNLVGGNTTGAFNGGNIALYGGSPLGTIGVGGRISFRAGDGGSVSGDGGDILLEPGGAQPGSSKGGILIPDQVEAPLVTTNKMYNAGGNLYWDGVALNGQSGGSITGQYKFETSTAIAPGAGKIRFNNAVLASVTELFISQTTDDGFDALNFLNGLASGNQIYIQDPTDAADFAVWEVSGAVTDEGSWFRVPATLLNGGDPIGNGNKISTTFLYTSAITASAPLTATTAELTDITNAVNTNANKVAGLMVWNTTTTAPVWALDDTDGGIWLDATGTLAHIPA